MEIKERTEGEITTLYLRGTMAGGVDDEVLRDEVESLIEAEKLNIFLDTANVLDIDSACLGEILHCHIRVTNKGGELRLVKPSETLRGLLTRTKIAWVHERTQVFFLRGKWFEACYEPSSSISFGRQRLTSSPFVPTSISLQLSTGSSI
jgi:anti-sigma B factor antagonist